MSGLVDPRGDGGMRPTPASPITFEHINGKVVHPNTTETNTVHTMRNEPFGLDPLVLLRHGWCLWGAWADYGNT